MWHICWCNDVIYFNILDTITSYFQLEAHTYINIVKWLRAFPNQLGNCVDYYKCFIRTPGIHTSVSGPVIQYGNHYYKCFIQTPGIHTSVSGPVIQYGYHYYKCFIRTPGIHTPVSGPVIQYGYPGERQHIVMDISMYYVWLITWYKMWKSIRLSCHS